MASFFITTTTSTTISSQSSIKFLLLLLLVFSSLLHRTIFYFLFGSIQRTHKPGRRGPWHRHTYKCLASQLLSAIKSTGLRVVSSESSEAMALAVGQEGSSQDSTAASLASQLLSAIKSTGLWVVPYFTNDPSNRKDHYSGSKVESDDVESAGLTNSPTAILTTSSQTHSPSSSSSSTPSHPISSPSQQPNIQSESESQTHLSNPIAKAFRELEMGKSFLTFILPTATMILAQHGKDSSPGVLHSILCLLCASLVALLYGISLRDLFPRIANAFEQLGIACIFTSFFIVVASQLPSAVSWIPLICFMASMLLSICSCLPCNRGTPLSSSVDQ